MAARRSVGLDGDRTSDQGIPIAFLGVLGAGVAARGPCG
jgi:hypothetical protein